MSDKDRIDELERKMVMIRFQLNQHEAGEIMAATALDGIRSIVLPDEK